MTAQKRYIESIKSDLREEVLQKLEALFAQIGDEALDEWTLFELLVTFGGYVQPRLPYLPGRDRDNNDLFFDEEAE